MSTSLHVTIVTRFGSSTEIIVFGKWTDAISAKAELQDSYKDASEFVLVVVTVLEGTA